MLFDMWDDGSGTKELGVFLSYPDDDYVAAEYFLLCCTPLLDETNCNGNNQIETLRVALLGLDLTWKDILVIIADNTSVNPSIARKLKILMIGCQSHVLALAVKEYTTDYSEVISKLHNLCVTFRTPKYRGVLRDEGCNISPKIKDHKWGALYAMLSTYFGSVGDCIEVIVRANVRHSFTPSERNQLIQLKKDLGFFNSVDKLIQGRTTNLSHSRALFNDLLMKFHHSEKLHHLQVGDKINHDMNFTIGKR